MEQGSTRSSRAPGGVAVHADGSIYVADSLGKRIRRIAPDGTVTTVAGGGPSTSGGGFRDGPVALARFREPTAIAFDGDGNLFIVDRGNGLIRKLSPTGEISSFADARSLKGVAVDDSGNVLFTQGGALDALVRKVSRDGTTSTLVGAPPAARGERLLPFVAGIAVGPDGAIYVADSSNDRVARVERDGSLTFIAGGRGTNRYGFATVLPLDDRTLLASGDKAIWKITIDAE